MDIITQRQIDAASRDKIIHDIKHNYFVEAGAGSGKTTVLVERMVAMVEAGVDISKISAITFTKAAANEFYARFQKRLIERSNAPTDPNYVASATKLENPTDETRNNCKKALQNIDLAFMGTIDAFCNMVMSEHPSEGNIPSDASITSDDEIDELYIREYARILNGEYNNPSLEEKAKRFKHYFNFDADSFIRLLKLVLANRDCKLVIPNRTIENLDSKFARERKTIQKIVKVLIDNPAFITGSNSDVAQANYKHLDSYKNDFSRSWEENIPRIYMVFKQTFMDDKFRLHIGDDVELTLQEGIDYFEPNKPEKPKWRVSGQRLKDIYQYIEDCRYQVALEFVDEAKEEILKVLRAEGKLTFNDYLVYLRDTLKKDAAGDGKLIKHIYERHSYFMIDEFQDTDPIQAEIFFYLAAKDIKPNWKDCIPHPGSLFIVGDPKQSIYRFKNADVASFLNVKSMFNNPDVGEVLYLYCNFRSTYEIRDYFNKTFEPIMLDSLDQSAYPLIPTDESEKKDDFTGIYQYEKGNVSDDVKTAQMILKLVNNNKYQIYAKEFINGKGQLVKRPLIWKDFMLITPGKGKLANYTKTFRDFNIPYYVEGNINFTDCPALPELIMLYAGITNINDNRYLYGALKSQICNISDKKITEAKEAGYSFNVLEDVRDLKIDQSLKDTLTNLKQLAEKAMSMSPSQLFAYLVENTDVFKIMGNKNMEYIYYAQELLKDKETNGEIFSHIDAYNFLSGLLLKETKLERCPGLEKDGNQVHLANLHKVKGLEAPVVILASPSGPKGIDVSFRMERKDPENLGYVFDVFDGYGEGKGSKLITTQDNPDLRELEENSILAEKLRQAYVAATRARNVLIIASHVKQSGEQYSDNPWKDLINKNIPDADNLLRDDKVELKEKGVLKATDIKEVKTIINNSELSVPSYKLKRPSTEVEYTIADFEEDNDRTLKQEDETKGDTFATTIGTMVHRLLELIIISKDKFEKEPLVKQIINENIDNVNTFGNVECTNILSNVYGTIHHGGYKQINGAQDDILPILMNAEEVYSEVPFAYKERDTVWNGIIDLLYKDEKGYHIIDWKTNKDDKNLAEHYKNQLDAYKKAIKESSGINVKDVLIYHIKIN